MNEDTLKGQWTQLKGTVREQWGKLTNDDVDQIQGRTEQLIGKIQERYGVARDEAKRQVDSWTPRTAPDTGKHPVPLQRRPRRVCARG